MSPLVMGRSAYRALVATVCFLLLSQAIEVRAQQSSTAPEPEETKYMSDTHEAASRDTPDAASYPSGDFREEDVLGPALAQEPAGRKGEGQHAAQAPGKGFGELMDLLVGSAASNQIAEASRLQATRQQMEDSLPVQLIDLEEAVHVANGDGDVATTGATDVVSHICALLLRLPPVVNCHAYSSACINSEMFQNHLRLPSHQVHVLLNSMRFALELLFPEKEISRSASLRVFKSKSVATSQVSILLV